MAGQIIRRGDRTWLVRVFVGRDEQGKRKYVNRTVHGTKKDAEKVRNVLLRDRDMGLRIEPGRQTLNQFLDVWLAAKKSSLSPRTFAGYEYNLKRYVRPALGAKRLSKITPVEIQELYGKLRGDGLSGRTIQYTNMMLKQAFKQAVQFRQIAFNPCEGVTLPANAHREMQVLTPDQTRRFLAVAQQDIHGALFALAITAGLRPSEYLALQKPDFDFEKRRVSIRRSIEFLPRSERASSESLRWRFRDTKKPRSRRTVKLLADVTEAILRHLERQDRQKELAAARWTEHNLVFTNQTGGPLDWYNLTQRHFRPILKAAGLPSIRPYDLRHTAATLALAAGVPAKVVSEQLGHASVALTLDTYSHVLPHMQDEAAEKVGELLAGWREVSEEEEAKQHTIGTQGSSTLIQ